jgi:hypothetical protein
VTLKKRPFLISSGGSWQLLAEFIEIESGKSDDRPIGAAAQAELLA